MVRTAEYRLDKARDYLDEAELLYREKIGTLPVLTNLYHAMMNSLFALFNLENPGNILHADIIGRFKKEYVHGGIFDRKYTDALDFAFHITHECNCDQMKPPGDEDINRLLPVVKDLVSVISNYLINKQNSILL